MHAVLCLSAQHLSNKARTENDRARTKRYRDISTEHRAQALHLLRVAAAANAQGEASDILPAIMILLILATVSFLWGWRSGGSVLKSSSSKASRASSHPFWTRQASC